MSNDLTNNKTHGQLDSTTDYASKVFGKSSVCAVSTILSNDNKPRKIFRSVVFFLFSVAFFYQCIAFLCYALQSPTVVDIEILRPEHFLSPAFTFCNLNSIKRSKYCAKYSGNCTKPSKKFCDENPRFCGTPDTKILVDDDYDLDIDDLFELNHEAEDMVDIPAEDNYNPTGPLFRWNVNENNYGACYTYFDRVNSPWNPVMTRRMKDGSGLGESFEFDPQENELIYPEARSGIVLEIHSPFEAVNPFSSGIFMRPGYLYRVKVKMTQEEMLPNECLNYTEVWLKNNKIGYQSQAACKEKCIGDMILKCLNCSEPQILYPYPNVTFCRHGPYDPRHTGDCKDPEVEIIECRNNCKEDCIKKTFSYTVQEHFLNRYKLPVAKNESRLIKVRIEYPDVDIQKIIHKPQFQVLEIFSLIGGLLAFWIGLSMFQVIEVFDCLFQMGKYVFKKRSEESESSAAA